MFVLGDFSSLSSGVKIWCTSDDFRNDLVTIVPEGVGPLKESLISGDVIFDNYGAYSMCCVLVDPKNSNVVWLATGENTNLRSAAAGEGIFKSTDGGGTWRRVGLERSEKIGLLG